MWVKVKEKNKYGELTQVIKWKVPVSPLKEETVSEEQKVIPHANGGWHEVPTTYTPAPMQNELTENLVPEEVYPIEVVNGVIEIDPSKFPEGATFVSYIKGTEEEE